MFLQKAIWGLVTLFAFNACVSSSSTSPEEPTDSSSSTGETPTSSNSSQSGDWSYPVLPAGASKSTVEGWYTAWKDTYFITYEDQIAMGAVSTDFDELLAGSGRITWDPNSMCAIDGVTDVNKMRGCTVSEGIGYGMLIAYFQKDWDTFHRLWKYSKFYRLSEDVQLTSWMTLTFRWNPVDWSSATDADLDIATALLLASYDMETENPDRATRYKADAIEIAKAIYEHEVDSDSKLILPGNTPMWKTGPGSDSYNPSYFAPVALRMFAEFDKSNDWKAVLDANYKYMHALQAKGNGLFPDWSDRTTIEPRLSGNGSDIKSYDTFGKESVRIPWRLAWDYAWYKSEDSKKMLSKMADFMIAQTGGSISAISDKTYPFWDKTDPTHSTSAVVKQYLAAYCLMGMTGDHKEWLDKCVTNFNSNASVANASKSSYSYFSHILQMMFGQLMNGKYIRPF